MYHTVSSITNAFVKSVNFHFKSDKKNVYNFMFNNFVYLNLWYLFSSLTTSFGKPGAIWNYSFNPCVPFTMPENPNEGFGDKCLSVSVSTRAHLP